MHSETIMLRSFVRKVLWDPKQNVKYSSQSDSVIFSIIIDVSGDTINQ